MTDGTVRARPPRLAFLGPFGLLTGFFCLDFWGQLGVGSLPGIVFAALGLSSVTVGVGVWRRRPINGTGPLLTWLGTTILVGATGNLTSPWAALPGELFPALAIPALLHVVLAFPAGRLPGRTSRAIVGTAYAANAGEVVDRVVSGPPGAPLTVQGHADLAAPVREVEALVLIATIVVAVVLLAVRWRRLRPGLTSGPVGVVSLAGVAALAGLVFGSQIHDALGWNDVEYFAFQIALIGGFPLVVAAALRSGALARTADVGELAAWFGTDGAERPHPRDALARALGDPSLQVVYEFPHGSGSWVDHTGEDAAAPDELAASPTRAAVPLLRGRGRAAIVYDRLLLPDPGPVERAARVAALAIDHERLTAELRASESEVRASRRRIVTSVQESRERLARDLHDGVQARLVLAGLTAARLAAKARTATAAGDGPAQGQVDALDQLRLEIDRTITQLREVVEDVMPALLREQGLFAALEEHLASLPLPARLTTSGSDEIDELDATVAAAVYFVVTEATLNTLKHAAAHHVDVDVTVAGGRLHLDVRDDGCGGATPNRGGHGLRGMLDRVHALGGSADVVSPPGGGTRITVDLEAAP